MAKSVLIVEDNEHQRNIYASILRFSGYEIVKAASGTEAIEKALPLNRILSYWIWFYLT
jgi:CheY-like chemotaxis protein